MLNEKETQKEDTVVQLLQRFSDLGVEAMQVSEQAKSHGKGIYYPQEGNFESVIVTEQKDKFTCKLYASQETSVEIRRTFDELLTIVNEALKQIPPWKRRFEQLVEEYIPMYSSTDTRLTTLGMMLTEYSEKFVKGGFIDFHLFTPIRAISKFSDILKLDKKKIDPLIPDILIPD